MPNNPEHGVGISGLGRVGRSFLRHTEETMGVQVNAITSRSQPEDYVPLLARDTKFPGRELLKTGINVEKGYLIINGREIPFESYSIGGEKPQQLKWDAYESKIVVEATGKIKTDEGAKHHLNLGAKLVIITSPTKDGSPTFVFGVNHKEFSPYMNVISAASCTTNCAAPPLSVLHEVFGIRWASIDTVHTYTGSQDILDRPNKKDPRRGRGLITAGIIPTITGANKAIKLVIQGLEEVEVVADAMRVPTNAVSALMLHAELKTRTTEEEIIEKFKEWSEEEEKLKGVLTIGHEDAVGADFTGSRFPSIIDRSGLQVLGGGRIVKVRLFYDNEDGFVGNLTRLVIHVAERLG